MQDIIDGMCRGIMLLYNYIFITTMIDFRYSKKKSYFILGTVGLFSAVLLMTGFFSGFFQKNHSVFTPALIFFYTLLIGSMFATSKGSTIKKLFAATMAMDAYAFVTSVSYSLSVLIFQDESSIITEFIVRTAIYVVLLVIALKFLHPMFIGDQFSSNIAWIIFDIIALLYLVCLLYCNSHFGIMGSSYASEPILINILFVMMIFTFAGMFYAFSILEKNNREKQDMLRAKNKDKLLEMELRTQDEIVYNAKKIKHDVKHHADILLSYLNDEKYDQAHDYLSQFIDQITNSSVQNYSNNHIVNAIFRLYDTKCCNNGIECTLTTDVPDKMKIGDTELCGLLSNLLENAVESCIKCKKPSLSFRLLYSDGRLSGYLDNTISIVPKIENGMPVTTKGNGGTGTKIISEIITKYGGVYRFDTEENTFLTRFTISNI